MRKLLVSVFVLGCGGQTTVANEAAPTAEAQATSEASGSSAPEASTAAVTTATASANPGPTATASATGNEKSSELTTEKGSAKGVEVTNDAGKPIKVAGLAWTSSRRTTKGIASKEVPNANVSFGSVTADNATASDVVCELPAAAGPGGASVVETTAMMVLVAQDAMPTASMLKVNGQIAKCANGKPVRIQWKVQSGALSSVDAGDAKVTACLKGALKSVALYGSGSCVASFKP